MGIAIAVLTAPQGQMRSSPQKHFARCEQFNTWLYHSCISRVHPPTLEAWGPVKGSTHWREITGISWLGKKLEYSADTWLEQQEAPECNLSAKCLSFSFCHHTPTASGRTALGIKNISRGKMGRSKEAPLHLVEVNMVAMAEAARGWWCCPVLLSAWGREAAVSAVSQGSRVWQSLPEEFYDPNSPGTAIWIRKQSFP